MQSTNNLFSILSCNLPVLKNKSYNCILPLVLTVTEFRAKQMIKLSYSQIFSDFNIHLFPKQNFPIRNFPVLHNQSPYFIPFRKCHRDPKILHHCPYHVTWKPESIYQFYLKPANALRLMENVLIWGSTYNPTKLMLPSALSFFHMYLAPTCFRGSSSLLSSVICKLCDGSCCPFSFHFIFAFILVI